MTTLTSTGLVLPTPDGGTVRHAMHEPVDYPRHPAPFTSRTVLAAAHVVADVRGDYTPGEAPPIDWEATIAFRRHLFDYGVGIAEGMDTSERGPGGLTWPQAQDLIRLGVAAAHESGAAVVAGAGTDQITSPCPELAEIVDAYTEQLEFVQAQGCAAVIRASHALVTAARSEDDYLSVYRDVLAKTDKPAIVHWLGTGFDPTLAGYWGHADPVRAMDVVVRMARENTPATSTASSSASSTKNSRRSSAAACLPGSRSSPATTTAIPICCWATANTTATACSGCSTRSPRSPRRGSPRSTPGTSRASPRP